MVKCYNRMKKQKLLNIYMNNITMRDVVDAVDTSIKLNKKMYIVPVNVDMMVKADKDEKLLQIINDADLTLADGKPLIWISKLLKEPLVEKVSGSDLAIDLLELSNTNHYSLFILGGKDGVAEKAKERIESKYRNIGSINTYSPRFGFENDLKEISKINNIINEVKPDILLACFGCPKQEKWVYNNINKYFAYVTLCAGATVDFLAGNVKRAPKWVSDAGLEWFYRFLQEPKRLFKRYFIDDIQIIKLFFKYRNK